MRRVFVPYSGIGGHLLNHGGANWRCRKPVPKKARSLAEITDGRIIGVPWEQRGKVALPVHISKRDKMGPKERELGRHFVFKPSAAARRARRDNMIEAFRVAWRGPGMSQEEIRERIESWKKQ